MRDAPPAGKALAEDDDFSKQRPPTIAEDEDIKFVDDDDIEPIPKSPLVKLPTAGQ